MGTIILGYGTTFSGLICGLTRGWSLAFAIAAAFPFTMIGVALMTKTI